MCVGGGGGSDTGGDGGTDAGSVGENQPQGTYATISDRYMNFEDIAISLLQTVFQEGSILVIVMTTTSDQSDCLEWCYMFDPGSLKLEVCGCVSESKEVDDYLWTETAILRLQTCLPLFVPANAG